MTVALDTLDFDAIARRERRLQQSKWWTLAVAFLISLIWLIPFYYLAISVFKTQQEYAAKAPLALPDGLWPIVGNAVEAWTQAKMGFGMLNSAFYGLVGAGLAVFFAAMAAYGLTRLDFRRKNLWFMVIFAGTVFPFQMYLIPLFFFYQDWGILNTHFGMILFYTAICIPFPTLVLKNFMNGLSREMDEAARMDGASEFTVFLRIILPNAWGPMTATFLLQFTWIWNDLLFSTVLGNRPETRSIMNALQVFQGSYASAGPNIVLTAALIASLPSIILFFVLRRHFMEGMRVTSL
ncbi:carbohydrate ABC transporter permease [Cucumibacter marinus]|uniref:carbohydrate ABC transporter permease n=1 Tax=Cucumibacter marinus TaxID=1121252 RepID=UPI0004216B26|nr:carbohydrate ABC transporter permease [Cucumibacter marinus]